MSFRRQGFTAVQLGIVIAARLAWAAPPETPVDVARDFALTWSTHTLAQGHQSLEVWVTPRVARADPQFLLTDTRIAFAVGLLPSLETQVSIDLNLQSNLFTSSVDPRVSSLWRWSPFKSDGPLGVGLIGRGSLGFDVSELEARLVLDKQLGRVLIAVNASYARSYFWNGRSGINNRLDESLGARFAISPNATMGLEFRLKSAFTGTDYQGSALYVGPTLSFHWSRVWLAVGLTAQVGADKAAGDRGNGEPLELRDNERFVARIILGTPAE